MRSTHGRTSMRRRRRRAGVTLVGAATVSLALAVGATASPSCHNGNNAAAQAGGAQQSHTSETGAAVGVSAHAQSAPSSRANAHAGTGTHENATAHAQITSHAHAKAHAQASSRAHANESAAVEVSIGSHANAAAQLHASGRALGRSHATAGVNSHGSARTSGRSSSHGPQGKVTICHATDSVTNPYVAITVSANALPAHMSNHVRASGWEDFLWTGSGCTAGVSGGGSQSQTGGNGNTNGSSGANGGAGKVTICHATDSLTNPYVAITVSTNALPAHLSNHVRASGWEDFLWTGANCTANLSTSRQSQAGGNGNGNGSFGANGLPSQVAAGTPPNTGTSPAGSVLGANGTRTSPNTSTPGTGETSPVSSPTSSTPAQHAVLHTTSAPASAVAGQTVAASSGTSGSSLPFTGFPAVVALLVGAGILGAGLVVRRLVADR